MAKSKPTPAPVHTDVLAHAARINDGKLTADVMAVGGRPSEEFAQAAVIAALAWEKVRGADPPFTACAPSHRERLIAEVEAILKVGPPAAEAATPFTDAAAEIVADIRAALDNQQRQLTEGEQ